MSMHRLASCGSGSPSSTSRVVCRCRPARGPNCRPILRLDIRLGSTSGRQRLFCAPQVIALPFKRGARETPISYLERAEIEAVLTSIDRGTALGRRDYALFALMFNTGARVQEALDLRRRDVRLEAPPQVRLHGKGNKVRLCPIWPVTAKLLEAYIRELPSPEGDPADALLFTNARGGPLTRFEIGRAACRGRV